MIKAKKRSIFLFSPGPFGGAEKIVLEGAKALNCPIWLIHETRSPIPGKEFQRRAQEAGVRTKSFYSRSRFDLKTIAEIKKLASQESIELVHSHGLKANVLSPFLGLPWIGTQHGKTSHDWKAKLLEKAEDLALEKAPGLICVSPSQLEDYKNRNKAVIENFASFGSKKETYSTKGKPELLFIGRLSKEKGILELLEAMKTELNANLTIVGDGEYRDKVENAAKTNPHINYLGFQKELSSIICGADALIMPSLKEGLPLAALEAAGAGLPILASGVGSLPELIEKNGLLFAPGQPGQICHAIESFIVRRREISLAAEKKAPEIRSRYSVESWRDATSKYHQKIMLA